MRKVTRAKFQNIISKTVATPALIGLKLNERNEDELDFNGSTYRSAIGGILFLSNSTPPDLMFPVTYSSRFLYESCITHRKCVKNFCVI